MAFETIRNGGSWIRRTFIFAGERLIARDANGTVRVYPIVGGTVGLMIVVFKVIDGG